MFLKINNVQSGEYQLLKDYENFKAYVKVKGNKITNFKLAYKKFQSHKMTFDDNLVVLLVNACIQNNVKEEVQTMHFLMWLAGTYKITMSSLKDLVNFTSNCLNNSSTDIFYNNKYTMEDIEKNITLLILKIV